MTLVPPYPLPYIFLRIFFVLSPLPLFEFAMWQITHSHSPLCFSLLDTFSYFLFWLPRSAYLWPTLAAMAVPGGLTNARLLGWHNSSFIRAPLPSYMASNFSALHPFPLTVSLPNETCQIFGTHTHNLWLSRKIGTIRDKPTPNWSLTCHELQIKVYIAYVQWRLRNRVWYRSTLGTLYDAKLRGVTGGPELKIVNPIHPKLVFLRGFQIWSPFYDLTNN